jgi:uncharacterized membrane protein YgdD (TMEM256/DUF423 family)
MNKTIAVTGAIFGLLAVILGALGAHTLKGHLPEGALESFKTGVAYQMYHALFLVILGSINLMGQSSKKHIFFLVTAGIICFSFSIYALTAGPLVGLDFSPFGWITPVGGILLIGGWGLFAYRLFRELN